MLSGLGVIQHYGTGRKSHVREIEGFVCLLVCKEKSQGRQEMAERVSE